MNMPTPTPPKPPAHSATSREPAQSAMPPQSAKPAPPAARTQSTTPRASAQSTKPAPPASGATIAYIMSRFPKLTETFVLYEMLALEAGGMNVEVYPLLRERQPVVHSDAEPWVRRAHYRPFLSVGILRTNLHFLLRSPKVYLELIADVMRGTRGSRNFMLGAIGIFPKVVDFARDMEVRGVDHVHAHFATHPALAAFIVHRLTGISWSFTAHGSDLHVDRRMLNAKVAEADFTVTVSEYNRELIIDTCGEWTREKIEVVHCGVDTDLFAPDAHRSGVDAAPLRILCVASMEKVKGHRYLVDACALLKARGVTFRCDLVGDGPLLEEVCARIAAQALGDHIHVHGPRARPEVVRMLKDSDVLALASHPTADGRREGIPVALMEAMACGVPVVSSAISGIPELVDSGHSGLLVPSGEPVAIADALESLARDPGLRRKMGAEGRRKVVRDFNLASGAARMRTLFEEQVPRPARNGDPSSSEAARTLTTPPLTTPPLTARPIPRVLRSLKWLRTPVRRRMGIRYVIDREPDYRKTIFLAGTARSGTTWVSELINARNEYRYIFEPFNPGRVPQMRAFGPRRYLRPGEENPELFSIAEDVVTGRIRNSWTERYNRRFITDERLVKDIRTNLMLKWLHDAFPEMPIVLLLRHPCAVANSYAQHGWHGSVSPLLSQQNLVDDYLRPHLQAIGGARDSFERALFIWCIETLVPLKQFGGEGLHVVFYERLAEDAGAEMQRIYRFLQKPFDASVLTAADRPSRTSRRGSAIANGRNPATSWIGKVDSSRVERAREIVDMFGLDGIYGDGVMPNPRALDAIMATPGGSGTRVSG